MEVNDAIKKSILQGCSGGALKDLARTQGMKSLRESGIRKILDGLTTIEEVLAATYEV
jgi:type IV pilus assembly protein PilB